MNDAPDTTGPTAGEVTCPPGTKRTTARTASDASVIVTDRPAPRWPALSVRNGSRHGRHVRWCAGHRGNRDIFINHRRNKIITAGPQRSDIAGFLWVIAQRIAQQLDALYHRFRTYDDAAPDALDQRVKAHDVGRPADKRQQQVKGEFGQRQILPRLNDPLPTDVDVQIPTAEFCSGAFDTCRRPPSVTLMAESTRVAPSTCGDLITSRLRPRRRGRHRGRKRYRWYSSAA